MRIDDAQAVANGFHTEDRFGQGRCLAPGEGVVQSEASKAFPPDRPTSAALSPFPEPQVPPFQAPNPVTGRPVREAN